MVLINRRRFGSKPIALKLKLGRAYPTIHKTKAVKTAVFAPGPKLGRALAYSKTAVIPVRKPKIVKAISALPDIDRPSAFIAASH